jgi:DNA-binding response OmpR family regulator
MNEKRLMVVDDEEMIRELYRKAFTRAGYLVETAGSAEEALELQKKNPAMVLFLDLKLPGMDGVALCRRIRHDWPMAVCVAVTGHASFFELSYCREAGFEDYYTKPAELADLLKAAELAFAKIERWKNK